MPYHNPLFRPISVYVIHDRDRDCILGNATDHWMVISFQHLQDLRLFETAADAWNEIGDRKGLDVQELTATFATGGPVADDSRFARHAAPIQHASCAG